MTCGLFHLTVQIKKWQSLTLQVPRLNAFLSSLADKANVGSNVMDKFKYWLVNIICQNQYIYIYMLHYIMDK